jgi:PAS domain S-box-containing protein
MKQSPAKFRIVAVVLLAGVLPWLVSLAAKFVFGDAQSVQEPLHEWFELTGTCIALGVAMLLLLRERHEKVAPHLLWVAAALVAMGLMDGAHGMAHFGVAWSWLRHGATFVGGVLFGLVWLPPPAVAVRREERFIFIVAGLVITGAVGVWWRPELLPAPWGPWGYSLPVKAANALGGLGFLAAALFFFRRYLRQPHIENLVFASHTLLFGTASLLFGFSHVWAADWWVWHGARLVAYGIVLVAAYEMVAALDQQFARHAQELMQANRALQQESAERRQAEAAAKKERQRLYDVMETLPAYVVLLTQDYHVPFANRFFRERFGESHGKRCYEYLFNRTEPCEICETYQVLKTKSPHRWEWTGPDGRNYDIYDFPFTDTDGSRLIMEMGTDITERKKAEAELAKHRDHLEELVEERTKELRESEERLRSLYVSMTEGLANHEIVYEDAKAIDYIITDVNPAYERITGLARTDAVGRKASDLYGTGSPPYLDVYARVASGGMPEDFETHFPPMKKHFVISAFSPAKGKFATVFTDITKSKRIEEELRESGARLNRSQEIAHFGSWELDLRSNTLTWSDEVYRIFGLKPQQFGATYEAFLDAVHPDDRAAVDAAYSGSLREGRDTYEIEHRIVRRSDGEIRFVYEKCEHLRDPSGKIIKSVGMVHDITDRKQAEEDLLKEKNFTDATVDSLPGIFYLFDEQGKFLRWNKNFEQVTGYSASEVAKLHPLDLFRGEDKRIVADVIHEVLEKGQSKAEAQFITKNGSAIPYLFTGNRLMDGQTQCVVGMGLDINERKQMEERLAAERLNLQSIFDAVNVGMLLINEDGNVIRVNDVVERWVGRDHAVLLGTQPGNTLRCIHAVSNPAGCGYTPHCDTCLMRRSFESVLQNGRPVRDLETELQLDGNSVRLWLDLSVDPLVIDGRNHAIIALNDITERKRTEEACAKVRKSTAC